MHGAAAPRERESVFTKRGEGRDERLDEPPPARRPAWHSRPSGCTLRQSGQRWPGPPEARRSAQTMPPPQWLSRWQRARARGGVLAKRPVLKARPPRQSGLVATSAGARCQLRPDVPPVRRWPPVAHRALPAWPTARGPRQAVRATAALPRLTPGVCPVPRHAEGHGLHDADCSDPSRGVPVVQPWCAPAVRAAATRFASVVAPRLSCSPGTTAVGQQRRSTRTASNSTYVVRPPDSPRRTQLAALSQGAAATTVETARAPSEGSGSGAAEDAGARVSENSTQSSGAGARWRLEGLEGAPAWRWRSPHWQTATQSGHRPRPPRRRAVGAAPCPSHASAAMPGTCPALAASCSARSACRPRRARVPVSRRRRVRHAQPARADPHRPAICCHSWSVPQSIGHPGREKGNVGATIAGLGRWMMATPTWQVSGQYYETCSCDFVCPCLPGRHDGTAPARDPARLPWHSK